MHQTRQSQCLTMWVMQAMLAMQAGDRTIVPLILSGTTVWSVINIPPASHSAAALYNHRPHSLAWPPDTGGCTRCILPVPVIICMWFIQSAIWTKMRIESFKGPWLGSDSDGIWVTGRQSEGSLIRGFDIPRVRWSSPNPNPSSRNDKTAVING